MASNSPLSTPLYRHLATAGRVLLLVGVLFSVARAAQNVEGFDAVEFHHNGNRMSPSTRDFRGTARAYMTAGWWAPGQVANNRLAWKTAVVPAAESTTFTFVGATSVLPSEVSLGPSARLSINGKPALTFTLGVSRDFTWKDGEFELKYVSKRVEAPYFGLSRQGDAHGHSGVFHFTAPASAIEAGKSAVLQVEVLPFPRWGNGWFAVKERRDALKQTMASLQGEIDALRQDVSVLIQHTHILATRAYNDHLETRDFQHTIVYQNGYRHLHPADLIPLQNGELLVMAREASEHYARDGDVVMLRSKDGGKTWGDRQYIGAVKDIDEREGCGVQLRDGTIVVGVYYNGNYDADGLYGARAQEDNSKPVLGAYIITSRDNGRTWSAPNYIKMDGMPFTSIEGPTEAPLEMPDGSIVMAVIGYRLHGDPKNTGAVLIRSTDKGATWSYVSTIASDAGGKLGGFLEPGIVRTKTGRIIAALRNHGPEHPIYVTYSDDDGKTWVPPRKTAMRGHPVDLIQLADGRILASYGIRPPLHDKPGGIRACFSKDNGETWEIESEVQLRKDFINWDIGYPDSHQLPDGRVLTVYYYNLFGRYFLGGTYWKP
ncbi:MAG: sialidase family protein [Verrucomicrobiota bacterium]